MPRWNLNAVEVEIPVSIWNEKLLSALILVPYRVSILFNVFLVRRFLWVCFVTIFFWKPKYYDLKLAIHLWGFRKSDYHLLFANMNHEYWHRLKIINMLMKFYFSLLSVSKSMQIYLSQLNAIWKITSKYCVVCLLSYS